MCGFQCCCCVFFFKQKTAYEMRISDWSSDVYSSDLPLPPFRCRHGRVGRRRYEDSYGRVWYLRRLGAEQDRTEAGIAGARRSFLLGGGLADWQADRLDRKGVV